MHFHIVLNQELRIQFIVAIYTQNKETSIEFIKSIKRIQFILISYLTLNNTNKITTTIYNKAI